MAADRVAVVAVHGVADQPPKSTARYIADLLGGHQQLGVEEFQEREFRIPVAEVRTRGWSQREQMGDENPALNYRVGLTAIDPRPPCITDPPDSAESIEHCYMRDRLVHYKPQGKDASYGTIALRSGGSDGHQVDIFEMHWADLSRLPTGLRLFFEFFVFLFFIARVGRTSLDFAHQSYRTWTWWLFAKCQAAAEIVLVIWVPILNMLLLAAATAVVPYQFKDPARVAMIGTGAILSAMLVLLLVGLRHRVGGGWWPAAVLLPVAVGVLSTLGAARLHQASPPTALTVFMLVWWAACCALVMLLLWLYQSRQPGAVIWGLVFAGGSFAMLVRDMWAPRHDAFLGLTSALSLAERLLILHALVGIWFLLLTFLTTVAAPLAVYLGTPSDERTAARRAAFTGTLTIVIPGLAMIAILIVLWAGLITLGTNLLPEEARYQPTDVMVDALAPYDAPRSPLENDVTFPARTYVNALIHWAAGPTLSIVLGCLGLLLGAAVWALLPSVLAEFKSIRPQRAAWLGSALTWGFRCLGWFIGRPIVTLFGLTGVLIAVLGVVADQPRYLSGLHAAAPELIGYWARMLDQLQPYSSELLGLGGAMIAFAVVSFGPLQGVALGFQRALDIASDVANWLRLHPADRNPMARICARYASLLRHLCESGEYRSIVIVAHSQGTVITADLLRFLRRELEIESDPALDKLRSAPGRPPEMPVVLLTMGCPLRQLYSLRFPHLYGWARHSERAWPGVRPEPAELLGVQSWTNVYASGDYVGRHLWFADDDADVWNPRVVQQQTDGVPADTDADVAIGPRREGCLGRGAHTKYWEPDSDKVADELVRLIDLASQDGQPDNRPPPAAAIYERREITVVFRL